MSNAIKKTHEVLSYVDMYFCTVTVVVSLSRKIWVFLFLI